MLYEETKQKKFNTSRSFIMESSTSQVLAMNAENSPCIIDDSSSCYCLNVPDNTAI